MRCSLDLTRPGSGEQHLLPHQSRQKESIMTTTESFDISILDEQQRSILIQSLSASISGYRADIVDDSEHSLTDEEIRWNAYLDERIEVAEDLLDLFDMAIRIEALL
jgi:hypothetical protein